MSLFLVLVVFARLAMKLCGALRWRQSLAGVRTRALRRVPALLAAGAAEEAEPDGRSVVGLACACAGAPLVSKGLLVVPV